jgi:hypothetical protein
METLTEFKKRLENVRHSFLMGTIQDNESLSKMRGNHYLLEEMFKSIEKPLYDEFYKAHIRKSDYAYMIWPRPIAHINPYQPDMTMPINFPAPKDININMMPVYLGGGIYRSLPEEYKHYTRFILSHALCQPWDYRENDTIKQKIGYLTIHEGWVPVGESQRRPGLHIERPGTIKSRGIWHHKNSKAFKDIAWGLGAWEQDGLPEDGIFMASTVNHSCAIWDVLIENPEDVTDKYGGIESMRSMLGEPRLLRANEMCWFTDRTPHESLPVQAPENDPKATQVYRQFFRLVVGPISVWYSKHNTPNPLGIQPDAPISDEDKFND